MGRDDTEDDDTVDRAGRPVRTSEVLIFVFPLLRAVQLPASGEPVGRRWLAEILGQDDPKMSREHCAFYRTQEGGLRLVDFGSTNGSSVNGARLVPNQPVAIENGDVLSFGRSVAVYRKDLEGDLTPSGPIEGISGDFMTTFAMRPVTTQIDRVVDGGAQEILIRGETGAGKQLIAEHVSLRRGRDRFVSVNCANFLNSMLESELFGYRKGAFSGADRENPGILRAHDGGTILFDEIAELPLELQAKLLRLIANREFFKLGVPGVQTVDLLILAATHRDLRQMVKDGLFRQDLLMRIAGAQIDLPPVRARREDIYAIVLQLFARVIRKPVDAKQVDTAAVVRLLLDPWDGNVREMLGKLRRIVELSPRGGPPLLSMRIVEAALGFLPPAELRAPPPNDVRVEDEPTVDDLLDGVGGGVTPAKADEAMTLANGSQRQAAAALGVPRTTLRDHIKRWEAQGRWPVRKRR